MRGTLQAVAPLSVPLCRPPFCRTWLGSSEQHIGFWGETMSMELYDTHALASPFGHPFPLGRK